MKTLKLLLIAVLTMLILTGCQGNRTDPAIEAEDKEVTLSSFLLPPNEAWTDQFGESEEVSLIYTVRLTLESVRLQASKMADLEKKIDTLENELHKRVSELENTRKR